MLSSFLLEWEPLALKAQRSSTIPDCYHRPGLYHILLYFSLSYDQYVVLQLVMSPAFRSSNSTECIYRTRRRGVVTHRKRQSGRAEWNAGSQLQVNLLLVKLTQPMYRALNVNMIRNNTFER